MTEYKYRVVTESYINGKYQGLEIFYTVARHCCIAALNIEHENPGYYAVDVVRVEELTNERS